MIRFITSMGPIGPVMLLISIAIIALTAWKSYELFPGRGLGRARLERGINAILFWGSFSAVLGFLGQFVGHYKSLNVMIHAEMINPKLVWMGIAEAVSSTIMGLTILLLSALAWFVLRCRFLRLTTRES